MATFYPNAGILKKAANLRTSLAGGFMHLFKDGFLPDVTTTVAELTANECDYAGYLAGGIPVVNWLAPLLDPAGGASIESGTIQFAWNTSGEDIGNLVGGWFYTTPLGLLIVGTFPISIPMEGPGQGIPLSVKLIESTGQ